MDTSQVGQSESPKSPTTVLEGRRSAITKPKQQVVRPPPQQQDQEVPPNQIQQDAPTHFQLRLDVICQRIVQVVVPVTVCALYCCTLMRVLSMDLNPNEPNLLDSTWHHFGVNVVNNLKQGPGDSAVSTSTWTYFIMVAIFTGLIILITFIILIIFYMQWHQYLIYYFYLPSFITLAILTPAFLRSLLQALNWLALDVITLVLVTWNFTVLGMMAIFGLLAPTCLWLQQFYLLHNSAILSVLIVHALPGWAPWLLLTFLVLWDLFAVLSPYGPLNLIIDLAEKEGVVEMPGLIYSTDLALGEPNDGPPSEAQQSPSSAETAKDRDKEEEIPIEAGRNNQATKESAEPRTIQSDGNVDLEDPSNGQSQPVEVPVRNIHAATRSELKEVEVEIGHEEKPSPMPYRRAKTFIERGVSIGLGDFIFYGLLIGLASKGRDQEDFYAVLTTLVAILFGLVMTLTILALTKRTVPALPISIGLGLSVAGLTIQFVPQLSNRLATAAIFV